MSDRERLIYESVTDEDLMTPTGDLSNGKSAVIQHVLAGPFGQQLIARIDAINAARAVQGGDENSP